MSSTDLRIYIGGSNYTTAFQSDRDKSHCKAGPVLALLTPKFLVVAVVIFTKLHYALSPVSMLEPAESDRETVTRLAVLPVFIGHELNC